MIRVGIVGASPAARWAAEAHVPALRELDGLALHAVATTRPESARAAAERYGAPLHFADGRELAEHPDVDLVSICVKVPDHAALVRAALAAGKHVLCEWPLAASAAEAEVLLALAERAGVVHAVGLQARSAPEVRLAAELLRDGYVGAVRSAALAASAAAPGGPQVARAIAWGVDRHAGMNVLTVPGGHALDALCFCAGEIAELSATLATADPEVTVAETGERLRATAPDHVALAGTLAGGAVVTAQVQGGETVAVGAAIEVRGSEGMLRILARGRHLQNSPLRVEGARGSEALAPLEVPERLLADVPAALRGVPAGNVAGVYAAVGRAIRDGAPVPADFAVAAHRHRVLETIEEAAASGARRPAPPAPARR